MLTAIRKALEALNALPRGSVYDLDSVTPLTISTIPPEDPETYEMLQRGDSVGVFQVESRAQMAMLPRLKPRHFYDLVVEVAIVRPGPIQGDMVHPYLRRRQGLEPVDYPSESVRRVLERTLGVPIFQEQVIELAVVAAGFTPGQADQLRRAMAAWKRRGGLGRFEQMIIDGMLARGHDRDFAERVFRQIQGFGEYGFPESHAASFALLVYVSAWLKCHAPSAFYCGLLNSLPMGFYSPSQIIQDAGRHDIEVRPVDVQHSDWDHRLELEEESRPRERSHEELRAYRESLQPPLRLGLRLVKGLTEAAGQRIAAARPFADAEDLARRAGLDDRALRCLARAGALRSLSRHRYDAHWSVAAIHEPLALEVADDEPPGAESARVPPPQAPEERPPVALPEPSAASDMLDDYRYLGLTLGRHPLAMLRADDRLSGHLARCHRACELERCRHGQFVRVAGLVTGRQRPGTASGVLFVTLEDETGNVNLVVWSSVLEQFRPALLQGQMLRVKGVVEREQEVIHVVAGYVEDVTSLLGRLQQRTGQPAGDSPPFRSRDFH
jgi:error-prone DNA polymerase